MTSLVSVKIPVVVCDRFQGILKCLLNSSDLIISVIWMITSKTFFRVTIRWPKLVQIKRCIICGHLRVSVHIQVVHVHLLSHSETNVRLNLLYGCRLVPREVCVTIYLIVRQSDLVCSVEM